MQCLDCLVTNDQNVSLYLKRKTNIACGNQLGNKPKFYQWLGIKLSQILNWIATFDMWRACKEYKRFFLYPCMPAMPTPRQGPPTPCIVQNAFYKDKLVCLLHGKKKAATAIYSR